MNPQREQRIVAVIASDYHLSDPIREAGNPRRRISLDEMETNCLILSGAGTVFDHDIADWLTSNPGMISDDERNSWRILDLSTGVD